MSEDLNNVGCTMINKLNLETCTDWHSVVAFTHKSLFSIVTSFNQAHLRRKSSKGYNMRSEFQQFFLSTQTSLSFLYISPYNIEEKHWGDPTSFHNLSFPISSVFTFKVTS